MVKICKGLHIDIRLIRPGMYMNPWFFKHPFLVCPSLKLLAIYLLGCRQINSNNSKHHWGQRPCQPFNQGSKLFATPFPLDELFPFVELFRLEPILSRIKEFPNSVVCPIVDAIDADTLEYSKNGGYQVGGFSWSLHFTWRDVPSRDLVHRKYTDPVGLVRSWSMCSDFMNLIGKY